MRAAGAPLCTRYNSWVSNLVDRAIHLIRSQAALLVTTATGGPRIDTVEADYQDNRQQLARVLPRLNLEDPFPWKTLWEWHGFYSGNFAQYSERRQYVGSLAQPVLDQLEQLKTSGSVTDWGKEEAQETWESIDKRLADAKRELDDANDLDGWQDVGRRCREIIIAAANLVFDESMIPEGQDPPKGSDAKRKIELYLQAKVPGSSHEDLRNLMKSALRLAHTVTHSESIDGIDAFAAAQATVLLVRCLQRIEGGSSSP